MFKNYFKTAVRNPQRWRTRRRVWRQNDVKI